jgi:hypothetical protein
MENKQLDHELNFQPPVGEPVAVHLSEVGAEYEDEELIECQLVFDVAPETYQRIDQECLFNLAQQARGPLLGGSFEPDKSIQIRAALRIDQVPDPEKYGKSLDDLAHFMIQLSSQSVDEPIIATEKWCALTVTQEAALPPEMAEMGKVSVGYSTIWREQKLMTSDEASNQAQALFEVLQDYYNFRQWPFEPLEGQTTLHMSYQGENGEWETFAHVNEENSQASFYSIYPQKTPAGRRMTMAELLTRINYGMAIGNFEMDFDDGEVRYKTSLDVTDDRLSFALLTQLSEANLFLTDRYFLVIQAVMEKGMSSVDALNLLEE